ncbi:2-oxo acid dehydrogenase subunit E2 [Anoxybacterium hadale]|uniref:2-oxo acid dehydrogenase subunit E2 n=1 Tax=Anoxybacterium hadale TaxID=3408580 RepID=A0ACD1AD96_9FIRM|nr:2-oxo acid dehydrogenase subunit E2 [Clostridiales bacterium]
MANVLVMPKLGLTMTEGTIAKWHKKEGDPVKAGDLLYEVETDKLTNEIEAKEEGVLRKIIVPEGASAVCLDPIAIIAGADEDITGLAGSTKPEEGQTAAADDTGLNSPAGVDLAQGLIRVPGERIIASPAAKKLAIEKGIDLEKIPGTGPNGRITLKDVEAFDATSDAWNASAVQAASAVSSQVSEDPAPRQKSTPMAEKIAAELQVRLSEVSEAGKRTTKADVMAFVQSDAQVHAQPERTAAMSGMRKVIARRMSTSHSTCPTVTYDISIDMSALKSIKDGLKQENVKVSYTDLLTYIAARTLPEFPLMNCSVDGETLIYKNYVNMGIAVALPDGLVVPVIRNAHLKGVSEISKELISLSEDAKNGKLDPDALKGGTFTITNLGMFGIESFSPIINLPEVAILGVNTIQMTQVYENGGFTAKPLMKVSLTADHRAVDGAVAAQFLARLKKKMENPYFLML